MPTQKIVTLYEYDELPTDAAKAAARDWWRTASQGDSYYSESVVEDFERVANILGIDIDRARHGNGKEPAVFWSGFWSQGDGASYSGTLSAKPDAGTAIREYAPQDVELHRIGDAIAALSVRFPDLYAKAEQGRYGAHYYHARTIAVDVEVGEDDDGNPLDAESPVDEEVTALIRDLADWLYKQLEAAYEDEQDDENVADNIRANEYTFTEDGKRED